MSFFKYFSPSIILADQLNETLSYLNLKSEIISLKQFYNFAYGKEVKRFS